MDMGEVVEKLVWVYDFLLVWYCWVLESGLYMGFLVEIDGEIVGGVGLFW